MIKSLIITVLLSGLLFAEDIYATFTVNADREANLVLSSTGIVNKVYVDVGDTVKQGDLLLELKNRDIFHSVKLARKKIELAELNLKYAKKAYDRFSKVKDFVDAEKYDQYLSSYERAKIELSKAEVNLQYKQAVFAKTKLKAPFSGVISHKYVESGDGVSGAKMATLFTLITPNKQTLEIFIDEKYYKKLKLGQTFTFTLDGSSEKLTAKVTKIHPAIYTKKRAVMLEVETTGIKVGLFGHGYLKVN